MTRSKSRASSTFATETTRIEMVNTIDALKAENAHLAGLLAESQEEVRRMTDSRAADNLSEARAIAKSAHDACSALKSELFVTHQRIAYLEGYAARSREEDVIRDLGPTYDKPVAQETRRLGPVDNSNGRFGDDNNPYRSAPSKTKWFDL